MKTKHKRFLRALYTGIDYTTTLPFRVVVLFGAGAYISTMAFTLKEPTLMEIFWDAVKVGIHSMKTFIREGLNAAVEEQEEFFRDLGLI